MLVAVVPSIASAACDYRDADSNGGWGWDAAASTSCPPLTSSASGGDVVLDDDSLLRLRREADGELAAVSVTDDNKMRVVHVNAAGGVKVIQIEEDEGSESGWSLTDWHYEDRAALNVNLPANADEALRATGWTKLSDAQSKYHDDPPTTGKESKFIHTDGREAVYYAGTGQLVTDPTYAGTFNYVNPSPAPEGLTDIVGIVNYAVDGIGHLITDIVPYWIGGNARVESTTPSDRDNDGVPDYRDEFPDDPTRWQEDDERTTTTPATPPLGTEGRPSGECGGRRHC